ncbi:phage tail protein [Citrobacter braakii]|uniref:phage tail protein n=1 Tax=Citrobacter braakii TaxID=57706 RepID=UPI00193E0ADA|nr:phage tail protein [Citrobacter braakii]MBM3059970.1 phage tail protein [Citrobacter braakii]
MSARFYTLLTDIGAAKLASAAALGVPLKITKMAVGDGGGVLPTPSAQQTALIAEKRRADLNMLYIDPQNSSQIIAEQVIPETEGGWWIREVGLFDETGALIAVGNCPESYKPQLAEGSGRTQTVRMVLITSSTDNITLKIDPAVVLATRKYVDDKVLELRVYVDDQMAKHIAAVDPHTQYAPKDSPTLTGTPKVPTAAAGNNTTQIASTAFVQAVATLLNNALGLKAPLVSPGLTGTPTAPTAAQTVNSTQIATTAFVKAAIAGLVGSSPAALDTLNELAAALGNDANFATTMTNALAGKQPLDSTLTNLSGKDVAGLLSYLRLGEAAKRAVGNGANQLPDMSYFANSIAGNGYAKLPSGLIIQWGSFAVTTTNGVVNSLAVTLPIAFPAALLMVNAMFSTQDPSTRFVGFDTAKSSRGVINFTYVTPTTNTIYWIVLGY